MVTETNQNRTRLPTTIAEMGPWHFWADPYSVGLSPEDAAAIVDGSALPDQLDRCMKLSQAAMNALVTADGPQISNMFDASTVGKPS